MVFLKEPAFSSQTKEKLSVPKDMFEQFYIPMKKQIVNTLKFHDKQSRALLKRFEEYRISQNKLLARKEISSLIQVNEDAPDSIRRRSVVSKLTECTSKKRDNTELYIVEGDSAAGPAKRKRNKELQAVLPLRGKILNTTGMDLKKAIKSEEICNIVNSIGCGIGSRCDSSKSRYERIIISADADPDGKHITCLILAAFINFIPDIVRDGRLYVADPPLYGWKDNKGLHFTDNKEDIPEGIRFTRFKGLGEMSDDEFNYTCLNPKTRRIYQVEYPSDIDAFNKILGSATGKSEILKELGIIRDDRN
jgi:DNA gyrase/topoisomerase IV subunit B